MVTEVPIDQDSVAWHTLMQAALEAMDEGFTVFDLDLRLLAWNKRFLDQFEIPDTFAQVGTRFEDFMRFMAQRGEYGPGDIETHVVERTELARKFLPHAFERTGDDGQVFEIRGNPIPGIGFVTVYNDITERRQTRIALEESRKQLETRVRERTAELQASEDWIRRVTNAVPVLIGYVDMTRTYRFANRIYEDWLGVSVEQVVGQKIDDLLAPALVTEIDVLIGQALAGEEVSHEYPLTKPDGQEIVASVAYRPHLSAEGEMQGYFVLGQDVTEQRQTEAQLRQGQKMQAVGQLSGGMAHDFNNLLTIIIGNLALAAENGGSQDDTTLPLVEEALDGARRGAALVKRLLAFARQQPIAPQTYNAKTVVSGMQELLLRTLGGSIAIDMQVDGDPCFIRADPNELENAVLNLAINARDAMPDGGSLKLSVGRVGPGKDKKTKANAAHRHDHVVIAVTDTGSGMPPEVIERAFEPFFTTKQFGGGSGLGLSMVYGFGRRSGGTVEIESAAGTGTSVRIYLPRVHANETEAVDVQVVSKTTPYGNETVLLVEDEPAVRNLTTSMLRHLGYEVMEAEDAPSAIEVLETTRIDLMLTDVDLSGGVNGVNLAQSARSLRPDLAVLLMSGNPDKALDLVRGAGEHYNLIAKPFESVELGEIVRLTLEKMRESNNETG
jgi:PAS domain S-box-containing protein